MRRRRVSFSSDPRWTALKRAGLAVVTALALLVAVLWFGDSGQSPHPQSEPATAALPLPDATTDAAEPVATTDPVADEPEHAPSPPPDLDAGAAPGRTTPPEPVEPTTKSKKTDAASAPPPKSAATSTGLSPLPNGYFIQLGVFDDTENVGRVFDNVTALGLPAHVQSRVMVGPFSNKREAEAARSRLKDIAEGTVLPPQASEKPKAKSRRRAK